MNTTVHITCDPESVHQPEMIRHQVRKHLHLDETTSFEYCITRRSIDARSRTPRFVLECRVWAGESPDPSARQWVLAPHTRSKRSVVVVGAGPAGYFAAIRLLEAGIRPIVLERGKDVQSRRKDIRPLLKQGVVHPDSNYCFGEGGAGAYSDGKLYTRSHKRGSIHEIFSILVAHGASEDIHVDAQPHIGSNRLPGIVSNIRETILKYGGEIHFDSRVTDFLLRSGSIHGVRVHTGKEFLADAVILATGHSARDIYHILNRKAILIYPKPFAMGVRVEHPQTLIDQIQYHQSPRHPALPAAAYRLVTQVEQRGVFSFCMCPGGFIVPASTGEDELVLNGMSLSDRGARHANSGMVVEIRLEDIQQMGFTGPLGPMNLQASVEKTAFQIGGGNLTAPAQRMTDFAAGRISSSLPDTSYIPGTAPADLTTVLPRMVSERLKQSFSIFNQKMKGYLTEEAILLAVESRTSSPVRIPRDPESLMHPDVRGLYPCGEGAGFAGGIVSAAMDGLRCAAMAAGQLS